MKKYVIFSLLCMFTVMIAKADDERTLTSIALGHQELTAHSVDNVEALPCSPRVPKRTAGKAIAPTDMTGTFVGNYATLTRANGNAGRSMQLTMDGDSTVISGFVADGLTVKAKIDPETGAVSIPWQWIGTYGDNEAYLAACTVTGQTVSGDSTRMEITGTVINNDSIAIDGGWAVFLPSTNQYVYAGQDFVLARANAKLTYHHYGSSTPITVDLVAKQNGDVLSVTNMCNYGITMDMNIRTDNKVRLGGPAIFKGATTSKDMYIFRPVDYELVGTTFNLYYADDQLLGDVETPRKITWGLWITSTTSGASASIFGDGMIELPFDLVLPEAPQAAIGGAGTEQDPYLINNTDDWMAVANASANGNYYSGKYLKVTSDLDFTGKDFMGLGKSGSGFSGVLDGDGHTITLAYDAPEVAYQGLVNYTGDNATVKNITAAGDITFHAVRGAGIVGWGALGLVIENCHNKATLHVPEGTLQMFAGILAYGARKITISNCHNEGDIDYRSANVNSFLGGILGHIDGGDLTDCYNSGNIFIADTAKSGVIGGIAARISFGSMTRCHNSANIVGLNHVAGLVADAQANTFGMHLTDCSNSGDVEATENNASSNVPTAGLINLISDKSSISNCVNTGNITGSGYLGGIFGKTNGTYTQAVPVKNCFNSGNITGIGKMIGGIGAFVTNYIEVDSCYNTGKVSAPSGTSIGGIVGQMQGNNSAVSNCINEGNVDGLNWVGGILGNLSGAFTLQGCYNTGDISAANRVGGLIGYSAYHSYVLESFNIGHVFSTLDAAGTGNNAAHSIGGLGGIVSTVFENCYNAGDIQGRSRVGGIIGAPYRTANKDVINYTPSIRNSYNCGKIVADADSCGHLLGVHVANNGTQWRIAGYEYLDTLENVYYLEDINMNCISEEENPEVGMSAAMLCKLQLNDKFTSAGDFCFPVLSRFVNDPYAKLYAAALIPQEGDSPELITGDFNIGAPEGIEWTADYAGLQINGNQARFSSQAFNGEITLTGIATSSSNLPRHALSPNGDENQRPTRVITIYADFAGKSAISEIADRTISHVKYYNLMGMEVNENTCGTLVRITTYTDGTSSVEKVLK